MTENRPEDKPLPVPANAASSSQPAAATELDRVKDLAAIGCTDAEIAAIIGRRPAALERRYGNVIRQERAAGAADLRRMQWDKAGEGNVPMLIWLGRQTLGQLPQPIPGADEAPPARVILDMSQNP